MRKVVYSNVYKSPIYILVYWNETFIFCKNTTKCWFGVSTSNKFISFTTSFDI